jgi:hypothetical protein
MPADAGEIVGILVLEDGPDCFLLDNIAMYTKHGYTRQDRRTEKGFDRIYMVKFL